MLTKLRNKIQEDYSHSLIFGWKRRYIYESIQWIFFGSFILTWIIIWLPIGYVLYLITKNDKYISIK